MIKQEFPLSKKYSILDNSMGMETFHYTMADPQMVPVDLLDMILPEDIYRMSYPYPGEEVEEEEEQQTGIIVTVSRFVFSPIDWLVYLIDIWVEGRGKKTLYDKF